MATLHINTADTLEFKNIRPELQAKDYPFISAQLGDWEIAGKLEPGIVIDAAGTDDYPLLLSANDARKLAKWLTRAADVLDGATKPPKQNKKRTHYEEDEDNQYKF